VETTMAQRVSGAMNDCSSPGRFGRVFHPWNAES
jgi:hypothetical protein